MLLHQLVETFMLLVRVHLQFMSTLSDIVPHTYTHTHMFATTGWVNSYSLTKRHLLKKTGYRETRQPAGQTQVLTEADLGNICLSEVCMQKAILLIALGADSHQAHMCCLPHVVDMHL